MSGRYNYAYVMNFIELRIQVVQDAFERGLRPDNLGPQPAPWMVAGLRVLQQAGELTREIIDVADKAGGTDGPDPWVGGDPGFRHS